VSGRVCSKQPPDNEDDSGLPTSLKRIIIKGERTITGCTRVAGEDSR